MHHRVQPATPTSPTRCTPTCSPLHPYGIMGVEGTLWEPTPTPPRRGARNDEMGEHSKAVWRQSRKKGKGSIETVAVTVPAWAKGQMENASRAMHEATAGLPLEKVPFAVLDPLIRSMIDVYLAGYKAGIHPGPEEPGIEEGARHLLTMEAKASTKDNREAAARMFRRAAELYETHK